MPSISVFDLVNTLKDYIHNERSLNSWTPSSTSLVQNWLIKQIIIPFSKRVKSTKYGYKVVPLEVNIRAYDKSAKTDTKLRLSFESVCEILNNDPHSIPYIKVNQTKKDSRKIYEDSFTVLDIDCSRIQSFNGTKYYNHKTTPISAQRLTDLNDSVLKVVDERISVYKQSQKQSAECTMQELLA